jgi:hypothetical protein
MADHKEPFTDKLSFRVLSKLAKACVIPVSNADPERIVSMLKKIQTNMRSDLNNDTICCLICAKQNQDKACFEFNPSDSVLRAAKKAVLTYQSNISSCNETVKLLIEESTINLYTMNVSLYTILHHCFIIIQLQGTILCV